MAWVHVDLLVLRDFMDLNGDSDNEFNGNDVIKLKIAKNSV